jgi:hypothetical protein
MFKKTTVVFCAALAYSQALANDEGMAYSSIQTQIKDLGQEVSVLKQDAKVKESRFLSSTLHREDAKPLGKLSGSQFSLDILKESNLYEDQSLIISGHLQANSQYWHGNKIDVKANNTKISYQSGKTVGMGATSLYSIANLHHYITGALIISGNSTSNSLNMKNAFVILGNLDENPIYATIGKSRVNFGAFSGGGTSTGSLTQMLFHPGDVPNISLNHYDCGLNTNISFFQTDERKVDFAYAGFYDGKVHEVEYSLNAGYVYDINGTGQESFIKAQEIGQRIGAVNFDASLTYDIFGLGSGYAQTTNKWAETNNGYARAWYLQGSIAPYILGKTTSFNLSYHEAYNTTKIPVSLAGAPNRSYAPKDTSIKKMAIISAKRAFLTDSVSLSAEYVCTQMYNKQNSHTYTLGISAYF